MSILLSGRVLAHRLPIASSNVRRRFEFPGKTRLEDGLTVVHAVAGIIILMKNYRTSENAAIGLPAHVVT